MTNPFANTPAAKWYEPFVTETVDFDWLVPAGGFGLLRGLERVRLRVNSFQPADHCNPELQTVTFCFVGRSNSFYPMTMFVKEANEKIASGELVPAV